MADITTFGEVMLRLSPPHFQRLEQTARFDVVPGGAEFNVAVACARMGLNASWVSRLPDNSLGKLCRNHARLHGVDTGHVVWAENERLGTYYTEFGAAPRSNRVIYDRADSAVSNITPGEIDWQAVLNETRHFHTTGITPALSDNAAAVTLDAIKTAKQNGIQVSYDLNYRSRLWSEQKAREVQSPLMEYVDILLTTEEDTKRVFGIEGNNYEDIAVKLANTFDFKGVCISLRDNPSVWKNSWSAILYMNNTMYTTKTYDIEVVDRIGSGDALTGALLSGLLTHNDVQKSLDIAVAFSALKQTMPGDVIFADPAEAEALLKSGNLRITR